MKQTIDNYKLTSMEEPSDEILSQLMKEAAEDAKKRGEEAMKRYFDKYQKELKEALSAFKKKYSMK